MEEGGIWELSVLAAEFCCEPKNTLKQKSMKRNKQTNHVLKQKQKQKTNNKIYFKKLDFKEKDIL